ncbi:MAG: thioredoxin-like domain-containing protein [Chthoniobacterales bacterium]
MRSFLPICIFALSLSATLILWAEDDLSLSAISQNRSLWPKEVTVTVAHNLPLVVNGKTSGSMKVGPGRTYPVKAITTNGVKVNALGADLVFPAEETDLTVRTQKLATHQAALLAASQRNATPASATASEHNKPTDQISQESKTTSENNIHNTVADSLSNSLVVLNKNKFQDFDASQLTSKKYLAIYFSASWCGPCRKFTPQLVRMYKRKKSQRDKFDIIFVSNDKSSEKMLEYMKEDKMEWPALRFDEYNTGNVLAKYRSRGIPNLVVIDETGQVLSASYVDGSYVGPSKVMKDLEKLLRN